MSSRFRVRELLLGILAEQGVRAEDDDGHLYFQPPESVRMKYPAIIYTRSQIRNQFADNRVYLQHDQYQVIVVDKDPESELVRQVSLLPRCQHVRHYTADNLNHDVFNLYA